VTNEHASSPALSATFTSAKASPLPMVPIALIVSVLRGPRYQHFAEGRRDRPPGLTADLADRQVVSLAHPGGNVAGFTLFEFSMAGKWLEV
jgi:hypothetical protein